MPSSTSVLGSCTAQCRFLCWFMYLLSACVDVRHRRMYIVIDSYRYLLVRAEASRPLCGGKRKLPSLFCVGLICCVFSHCQSAHTAVIYTNPVLATFFSCGRAKEWGNSIGDPLAMAHILRVAVFLSSWSLILVVLTFGGQIVMTWLSL